MHYSVLYRKRAMAVQSLQEQLGFPSDVDLSNTIDYNILRTCQFNCRDIKITNKMKRDSNRKERTTSKKKETIRYCHRHRDGNLGCI